MNRVTVMVETIKRAGHSKSLKLVQKHNLRQMHVYQSRTVRFDEDKSYENVELVPLNKPSLPDVVFSIIENLGIDYSKFKKNRGYASEFLFSVTAGYECNFVDFYNDCLNWLRTYHPECLIAHAIIHFDEATPHMHVIVVPIVNGELQADKIKRYKGETRKRNKSLYEYLTPKYDLTTDEQLKGAIKKVGAELVIDEIVNKSIIDPENKIYPAVIQSIHSRPEVYMKQLGIGYDEIAKRLGNNSNINRR